jgi:GntR family transcriptional repressor for pyruvate dehydrogenase complex
LEYDLKDIQPLRREPLNVEITRKLLDYLLSGSIRPGQRIPSERQLTQALGVSRSAIRETNKSLSLLGLLDVRQGDGTYLSRSTSNLLPRVIEWGLLLDEPNVVDLMEARKYIEIVTAGLAAERRDETDIEELRAIIRVMRRATDDIDTYVDADTAFHLRLAQAAGNTVFENLLGNFRALLRVWGKKILDAAGETESSLAMHTPILEAVERGDSEAASQAMVAHMERSTKRLREALDEPTEEKNGRSDKPEQPT